MHLPVTLKTILLIVVGATAATAQPCFDYQDSLNPVGQLASRNEIMTVVGATLFSVGYENLQVVDISNPSNPAQITELQTGERQPADITATSTHLYVAGLTGLHIFDISDTDAPVFVKTLELESRPSRVAAEGTRLHVLRSARYEIYDITEPETPQKIGDLPGSTNGFHDVLSVDGSLAMVELPLESPPSAGAIQLVDVSDATQPHVVATFESSALGQGLLAGDRAYLVSLLDAEFRVFDISTPSAPQLLGATPMPYVSTPRGPLILIGDLVFVSNDILGMVFDVATPSAPILRARFGGQVAAQDASGHLYGRHADFFSQFMQVLEKPHLLPPIPLAPLSSPLNVVDLVKVDQYLYASNADGVHVIDVTNPASPLVVGMVPMTAGAVAANGGTVFAAQDSGIAVIDSSDPWAPGISGWFDVDHPIIDMVLLENRLLVATADGFLLTVDISDPAYPQVTSSIFVDNSYTQELKVRGSSAFFVSWDVHVFDVSSPDAPVLLGSRGNPDGSRGVAAGFPTAYGLDPHGWVFDFDARNPQGYGGDSFVESVPGYPLDAALEWPFLYVTTQANSICVLDLRRGAPRSVQQILLDSQATGGSNLLVQDGLVITYGAVIQITYAQCTPPTPVALTDLQLDTLQNGIRLQWKAADAAFEGFRVQRAEVREGTMGTFVDISGPEPLDPDPPWVFVDPNTQPGCSYAYRVAGLLADGGWLIAGPVFVTTPGAQWSLGPLTPNPSSGLVNIRFTIPDRDKPDLEIFDAAGRRVRRIPVGPRHAGTHQISWDGLDLRGLPVANGIYFTRLRSRHGTLSRSVLILR